MSELIEQVCARPAMYTGSYKFESAVCYIEGYYHALAEFLPEQNPSSEIRDFSLWLAEKFAYPRNYGWDALRRTVFPDDEVALAQLRLLYEEFSRSKK